MYPKINQLQKEVKELQKLLDIADGEDQETWWMALELSIDRLRKYSSWAHASRLLKFEYNGRVCITGRQNGLENRRR